jgi:hypothetical protein
MPNPNPNPNPNVPDCIGPQYDKTNEPSQEIIDFFESLVSCDDIRDLFGVSTQDASGVSTQDASGVSTQDASAVSTQDAPDVSTQDAPDVSTQDASAVFTHANFFEKTIEGATRAKKRLRVGVQYLHKPADLPMGPSRKMTCFQCDKCAWCLLASPSVAKDAQVRIRCTNTLCESYDKQHTKWSALHVCNVCRGLGTKRHSMYEYVL